MQSFYYPVGHISMDHDNSGTTAITYQNIYFYIQALKFVSMRGDNVYKTCLVNLLDIPFICQALKAIRLIVLVDTGLQAEVLK